MRAWTRLLLLPLYVAASSLGGLLIGFQQGLGRNLEIAWASGVLPGLAFVSGSVLCALYGYRRGLAATTRGKLAIAIVLTGVFSLLTYWVSAVLVGYAIEPESKILRGLVIWSALTLWPVLISGAPGLLIAALAPPLIGRYDAQRAARRLAGESQDAADGSEFARA